MRALINSRRGGRKRETGRQRGDRERETKTEKRKGVIKKEVERLRF